MNKILASKPNRLSRLVHQPGGVTMDEAVQAADANLETIREKVVAEIEAIVERMQAVGTILRTGPDERALEELYTLANSVVGMAGVFGMAALGQVSYSLCDLVDRMRTRKKWDGAAMQVHMDSLRLVRSGTQGDGDGHRAVIAALRQVVERL